MNKSKKLNWLIKATTRYSRDYIEYKNWSDFYDRCGLEKLHSWDGKPGYLFNVGEGRHLSCWYVDGNLVSEQELEGIMKQVEAIPNAEKLLDARWWVREMVK